MEICATPQISVVIAFYNHEKFIDKTLAGIEAQEFDGKIEVIIHDDASTDGSEEIYRQFAAESKHAVKIIRQEENIYSRRISLWPEVLSLLSGEYIAFCDGDDYWTSPTKLSNQYKALEVLPNVNLCFHKVFRVNYLTEIVAGYFGDYGEKPKLFPSSVVIEFDGGFIPTASILLRRNVFEIMPKWVFETPTPPGVDYFFQAFGSLSGGALYLPMCAAAYREGDPQSWTNRVMLDPKNQYEFEITYLEYLLRMREFLGTEYEQSVDTLIMRRFISFCHQCFTRNQIKDIWPIIDIMRSHQRN